MEITESVRLVVATNRNQRLLAEAGPRGFFLPKIEVPVGQRRAKFITGNLKERCGLETICLFGSNACSDNGGALVPYQVLELRNQHWLPRNGVEWLDTEFFLRKATDSQVETVVVEDSLKLADAYNAGSIAGVFGRSGWLDELADWMRPHLRRRGESLTGGYLQFNEGPSSTLVKLDTTRGAVWFKGFNNINIGGFRTSRTVAARHPIHVPEILAVHDEWNGLLMSDVDGKRLDDVPTFENWKATLLAMARIQFEDTARTDEFVELRFKDRRLPRVLEIIDPLFEVMGKVMSRQQVTPPPVLAESELQDLATACKYICGRLMNGRIGPSLIHGDAGPHNVLVSPRGVVFIDWSEAYVSHPFLFFEYLLAFLERAYPEVACRKAELYREYSEPWRAVASVSEIDEAIELTPIVAPLFNALEIIERVDPKTTTPYDKLLRSLVRLIKKRVDVIGRKRVA